MKVGLCLPIFLSYARCLFMIKKIIRFFLENRLVTFLLLVILLAWGIYTAPFNWQIGSLPNDPVPVDAIPDLGENQQIVFTNWPGRSPQDIEDQISYPLTTYLLGIPGVKSIRSSSIFGFSSIFIIFEEGKEFYWTRSRIVEKLSALPAGLLPPEVQPALGPDATALGQVYWYTIEGRDESGQPTGGWDLHELRKVQDFYVKYALSATEGVSEVASIGGFVQEFQVIVDPVALQTYNIALTQVMKAVQQSNKDVGAKTIEINQAEYLVRGLGYIKNLSDLEQAVVTVKNNTPIRIGEIARVTLGPATRRGLLDKGGAEVVGGVVVARYGANPMQVIQQLKDKILGISSGLPQKTLEDGRVSKLTIVPFYDRSTLIQETLGTLEEALSLEILITILVVIIMVYNLRASFLIASLLPIAVLMVFIAMKYFHVDANIVALSGIAIAIGTMVDLGIILSENVIKHLDEAPEGQSLITTIYNGASEVSSAIITAVTTTIVSFIPVFTMEAAEGKLFGPLAFTKTFALVAALIVSLLVLPTLAYWFFGFKIRNKALSIALQLLLSIIAIVAIVKGTVFLGVLLLGFCVISLLKRTKWFQNTHNTTDQTSKLKQIMHWLLKHSTIILSVMAVTWLLATYWLPLGPAKSVLLNMCFVAVLLFLILGSFTLLEYFYVPILRWCLAHKAVFLSIPAFLIVWALVIWLGFQSLFGFIGLGFNQLGVEIQKTKVWSSLNHTFPGIGKEFMPALNEGSFLLMPTAMPHSGIAYNKKVLAQLDMLVSSVPEVEMVVGKLGRVESALDPAPISMYENIINYKPEYAVDDNGRRMRYKVDRNGHYLLRDTTAEANTWVLDKNKNWVFDGKDTTEISNHIKPFTARLIQDEDGQYFRNWRAHIHAPDDIWNELIQLTKIPGVTSAPKLQPIETRLVMLQTGMRAPMGVKVFGPDLLTIEKFGEALEQILQTVPSVKSEAVYADKIVGKPYLTLDIDRQAIARFGLSIVDVQQTIETAIGGMQLGSTVNGRERFPITMRYPRELRDNPEAITDILVPTPTGEQVPLGQLVEIGYEKGPQAIKSEDTFLVGYVLFDKRDGFAEVSVVNDAQNAIQQKIATGELVVPAGVNFKFSGSYENQVRAEKRLSIIVPLVLLIVFIILYFQFKSVTTSLMVFLGIAMAFSGGFIMLWCYGQPGFADFNFFGTNMRDLFHIGPINLSVAVWVGFIALFGIATDDGILMATYLDQSFDSNKTSNIKALRTAVVEAGKRRIKPAVMTSATTIIALLPILTSTGKGSDIMIPMAIPAFGGMLFAAITYFIVPVLYAWREERKLENRG